MQQGDGDRHDLLGLPAAQAFAAARAVAGRLVSLRLTCTHANVTDKGEYRAACAELGLIFVAPDTSPRGNNVPDDEAYDFGHGAGFYVDATQAPYAANYRMASYITDELPEILAANFPADRARHSIMGHSMGGHGALTIALRNPGRFRAVSAFAPIVARARCRGARRHCRVTLATTG